MGFSVYTSIYYEFDLVDCKLKHGVDIQERYGPTFPMSSDEFFRTKPGLDRYDLIYVDDDHRELPAIRSMANAIHHLAPGAHILDFFNDCLQTVNTAEDYTGERDYDME